MKTKKKFTAVVDSVLSEGCTGFTRGTRSRWFEMELACGHEVERYASPSAKEEDHPKKVVCDYCPS